MSPPKTFVSYAGENVNIASRVCEGLRAQGIHVFFAPWEHLGDGLVRKLNEGLGEAESFVIFLSPESVTKPWPLVEQEVAVQRNIEEGAQIITVNLGVDKKSVPALLRRFVWIDGTGARGVENAIRQVSDSILRRAGRPSVPVVLPLIESEIPAIPSQPSLSDTERAVVGILFRLGISDADTAFQIGHEPLAGAADQRGIDSDGLDTALEVLKRLSLVKFDRFFGGGIGLVLLTTRAVEACCQELIQNYQLRKRTVLLAVAEIPISGSSTTDEIIERTGEETWLVLHVLKEARHQGDLKLQPVFIGRAFYSIYAVSPLLRRKLLS
jgi:hypothetical protein